MVWPDGFGTPLHLVGRARDLVTTADGERRRRRRRPRCDGPSATTVASRPSRSCRSVPASRGWSATQGGTYLRTAIDRRAPGRARSRHAAAPPARRHRRHQPHRRLRVDAPPAARAPPPQRAERLRRPQGPHHLLRPAPRRQRAARVRRTARTTLHATPPAGALVGRRRPDRVARVPRASAVVHAPSPPRRRDPGRRRARDRRVLPRQLLGARRHRDGAARVHGAARVDAASLTLDDVSARRRACCRSPSASGRPSTWCSSRPAGAARSAPTCRRRSPSCRRARTSTTCCAASPRCPALARAIDRDRRRRSGQVGHAAADGLGRRRLVGADASRACRRARAGRG